MAVFTEPWACHGEGVAAANDDAWQAGHRPTLSRGVVVMGAVLVVVLTAVLARVDAVPEGLVIEQRPPEPATATAADDDGDWPAIGSWRRMAVPPVGGRSGHVAHWTGTCLPDAAPRTCGELLVWGGWSGRRPRADGAAYDPATDTWRALHDAPRSSLPDVPLPSVWTGSRLRDTLFADPERPGELVVWGATGADLGVPGSAAHEPRGVAFDPATGRWRVLPEAPIAPRIGHAMTWTGEEVLVWGGRSPSATAYADGAAYNPEADAWRLLPPAPLRPRSDHVAVYLPDADAMFVWGGVAGEGDLWARAALIDGAVFQVSERQWRRVIPPPLAPVGAGWRATAARESGGEEGVLVVAPLVDEEGRPALAHYSAGSGRWQLRPVGPVGLRSGAQAGGGDNLVVVWGGASPGQEEPLRGAVYYTLTGVWWRLADRYHPRQGDRAVWTGMELIVWGGGADGAVFDPSAQSVPETRSQAPGEQRAAELPAGSTTNWPILPQPRGDELLVTVHGLEAADVEVWLTAGHGRQAQRRDPVRVDCPEPHACEHGFEPFPDLIPGLVRVHLASAGEASATLHITIE
jgi:hypothetical protein